MLTQTEFGKRIGMSRDGIAAYERGIAKPTGTAIQCIVATWGVSKQWLMTGEGEMFDEIAIDPTENYPPIIRAVLRSYNRLNPAEQEAFSKFLDNLVEEYASGAADATADILSAAEANTDASSESVPG